jgi:2-polyprenyl-3-methyl-5-hydroxy-6-metoxy-1,4-benzoquinol methylase
MKTFLVTSQRAQKVTSLGPMELNRPCPVCGNSYRKRCQRWYAIPEFEVLRCRDCGFTFINEVVNDNSGFPAEYDFKVAPLLVTKAANDFERVKEKLKAAGITEDADRSLLDVGCGIGNFLQQAQRAGWRVAGLDLSPSVAAYAREQRGLDVNSGSIEANTSFPPTSFDLITMFGVIEHLANPRGAAEECARLLRPGGILILQTPTEDGLMRRVGRLLYWATGGLVTFQVKQLYQMGGGHSTCFNRRSMRTLLDRYGFDVLSLEQSTYGLRVLLMRFDDLPFFEKLINSLGTFILFSLGQIIGGSNHMTVCAQRRASASTIS